MAVLSRSDGDSSVQSSAHEEYVARWGDVMTPAGDQRCTIVVLEPIGTTASPASVIEAQRITIKHLLIRQALIEERERRAIGRAMHDDVLQELARIRMRLASAAGSGDQIVGLPQDLDAVIDRIREMVFKLSPPILEDLGLLPAMQWLAEHMSKRYGMRIEIATDAVNPALSMTTKTIAFRAVRELINNAAKHAPGADVTLSCESDASAARICVRDAGRGFDMIEAGVRESARGQFGLLSLDQEISGVGGSFELISAVGAGTRATITVPLERGGRGSHA